MRLLQHSLEEAQQQSLETLQFQRIEDNLLITAPDQAEASQILLTDYSISDKPAFSLNQYQYNNITKLRNGEAVRALATIDADQLAQQAANAQAVDVAEDISTEQQQAVAQSVDVALLIEAMNAMTSNQDLAAATPTSGVNGIVNPTGTITGSLG